MPVPTPLPTVTAAVLADQGLPQSVVDAFTIIGSIATAAGVIAALYFSTQGARRQRRLDEEAQARLIFGTVEFKQEVGPTVARMRIINASDAPVWDLLVGAGTYTGRGEDFFNGTENTRVISMLPPGTWVIAMQRRPVLVPSLRTSTPKQAPRVDPLSRRNVTVTFRDSAGVWWERSARGHLKRLKKGIDGFAARGVAADHEWAEILPDS